MRFLFKESKRFIFVIGLILTSFLLISCNDEIKQPETTEFKLNLMSYNMRFENISNPDPIHSWSVRKNGIVKSFGDYDANIVGTQELEGWQYNELMELLGDKWSGFGKPRFLDNAERVSIIYRNDIFELLEEKTFWLSETPDVVGSKGWGAAHPRITTYGKFKHISSGYIFYVYNTHLDHKSSEARNKGIELILKYIDKHPEYQTFITGDFNMYIDSNDFKHITEREDFLNSFAPFSEKFAVNNKTSHGFNGGKEGKAIDFIFYKKEFFDLLNTEIIYDRFEERFYLSDHYPVLSNFILKENTKG